MGGLAGGHLLWQRLPGRVAASLLKAIDLPELVTTRLGDYEALALELASNPALLKATREKLWRNRTDHAAL